MVYKYINGIYKQNIFNDCEIRELAVDPTKTCVESVKRLMFDKKSKKLPLQYYYIIVIFFGKSFHKNTISVS